MIRAMQTLGVPYEVDYANKANSDLEAQAKIIVDDLMQNKDVVQIMKLEGIRDLTHTQIVALIAYLQRVGTDIKTVPVESLPEH
jgi:cytochrome c oxidase cbb3-type subunit I/II